VEQLYWTTAAVDLQKDCPIDYNSRSVIFNLDLLHISCFYWKCAFRPRRYFLLPWKMGVRAMPTHIGRRTYAVDSFGVPFAGVKFELRGIREHRESGVHDCFQAPVNLQETLCALLFSGRTHRLSWQQRELSMIPFLVGYYVPIPAEYQSTGGARASSALKIPLNSEAQGCS